MGDRDLFTGSGDSAVIKTQGTVQGQPGQRDVFTGGGDQAVQGQTGAALPGDLHSVWGKGNCNWKPDKDNTHPAVQAWQAASREHWHDPIKLDCNGFYTAKNPDCLDSIASRVIETASGKPATGTQIKAEKEAIIQANLEHYPDIACNPHFIRDGWVLALPGLKAPDNCTAPEAPPVKPVAPEPPRQPEPPPEPPPRRQPSQRRTDGGTGVVIDNEPGGTVTIHEGNGVDCACGPPPAPLDGRTQQRQDYSELPPPPPPILESQPQVWGRNLGPGSSYYTTGPQIFVEPRYSRHHFPQPFPPGYAYGGQTQGWNGQTETWNGQPQPLNGQPQGWTGQPGWGQPQVQPHMSYWQYQQYLRHQQQMQRRGGYQPTVSITANLGTGSDWVD